MSNDSIPKRPMAPIHPFGKVEVGLGGTNGSLVYLKDGDFPDKDWLMSPHAAKLLGESLLHAFKEASIPPETYQ